MVENNIILINGEERIEKNVLKKEFSVNDLMLGVPPRLRQKVRVLFRDNFRCTCCESQKRLHIHHMDENRRNNHVNNLMTLCSECHLFYHRHGFF